MDFQLLSFILFLAVRTTTWKPRLPQIDRLLENGELKKKRISGWKSKGIPHRGKVGAKRRWGRFLNRSEGKHCQREEWRKRQSALLKERWSAMKRGKTTGWFSVKGERKRKTTCGLARHCSGGTTEDTEGLAHTQTHTFLLACDVFLKEARTDKCPHLKVSHDLPFSPRTCYSLVYKYKNTRSQINWSPHPL